MTWLPPELDETAVVDAAYQAGVGVEGVGPDRLTPTGPGGLIFGFATVGEHAIAEGVDLIGKVIDAMS